MPSQDIFDNLLVDIQKHCKANAALQNLPGSTLERNLGVSPGSRSPDSQNFATFPKGSVATIRLPKKAGWSFWLLAVCFAIALSACINSRVFFSDEISTLYVAKGTLVHTIQTVAHDVHPPLYFVTAHVFAHLFPPEWLRALSALYAFLAFLVLRRLAPMLLPHRSTHFPYLLLFASSPFIIFVSQMARYYSMTLLLAVAATYCLLAYVRYQKRKWCIWYFLALLALIYTSYLTVVMILAHIVYIFFIEANLSKSAKRVLAIGFLVAGVCYIPWLIILVQQYQAVIASESYQFSFVQGIRKGVLNSIYVLYCFALGDSIAPWNVLRALLFLLPWIAACSLGVKGYKRWRHLSSFPGLLFFVLPLGAAILLLFIALQQINLIYVPMRIAFLSPFFLLLAAEGFSHASKTQRTALLAALLLVNGFSLFNYYTNRETTNWTYNTPVHDILEMLDRLHTPGTLTIVDNYNFNREFEYYRPSGIVQGLKEQNLSSKELKRLFKPFPRVLFLHATRDVSPDKKVASMLAFLQKDYRQMLRIGYIEEDAQIRRIKELIVGRDVNQFKIHLDLFERDELVSIPY